MNSAIKLLAQYETDMLKSKLRSFPAIIKEQKQKVREAREAFSQADMDRSLEEANIMTDIASDIDPATGKALYSNDKTRQAELIKRKLSNDDYKIAGQTAKEAEYELNGAQDELDQLVDEFKSYRYIVSLTTQELALLASSEQEETVLSGKVYGQISGLAATKEVEPY